MKVRSPFGEHNLISAVDLRVKVRGALPSTSSVDLRVKVRSPFGEDNLGSAVDLRVKFRGALASTS